jgi:hypothetical protein
MAAKLRVERGDGSAVEIALDGMTLDDVLNVLENNEAEREEVIESARIIAFPYHVRAEMAIKRLAREVGHEEAAREVEELARGYQEAAAERLAVARAGERLANAPAA